MTAENAPYPTTPDTIVLIHGLWMTPRSWEKCVERYEGKGYRVLAPAYSGLEVEVEALNEDPSPIEALTVPAIVENLEGCGPSYLGSSHRPVLGGVCQNGPLVQCPRTYG